MADKPKQPRWDEESEAERALRARVHRHMGMTAAILAIGAVIVALARMRTMFGVSPWEALGIGTTTLPWLLLILGAGVVFSLGTTRLMFGIEKLLTLLKGKKAGK